ncbi:MAG: hypothetical protein J6T52_05430 [Bacteroidaceae bacterium]|nr:hypothetical protein [Bacteroidaceae bacterium]
MKKIYIIPSMDSAPMISLPYMLPPSREEKRGYAIDNHDADDDKIIKIEEQTDDYGWFIDIN